MRENRTISDMGDMTFDQFSVAVNFFAPGDKILINSDPYNFIIFHDLQDDYCLVNNSSSDERYSLSVEDLFNLANDKRIQTDESISAELRLIHIEDKARGDKTDHQAELKKVRDKLEKVYSLYYYSMPAIIIINVVLLVL